MKDATIAARAAGHIDRATGGVVPALHLSTTFARDDAYAPIASDHVYLRDDNDAARLAERIVAQLEQARAALLFPSGMAAIAAALRPVGNGGTLVLQRGIYWGTTQWVRAFCDRRGVRLVEVGTDEMTRAVEQERPEVIFVETPSNPWLETVDIAALARVTRATGSLLVVDSTAATPILTKPLVLGADIVVHAATKALNGHSDVLAGVLATNAPESEHWRSIVTERHDGGAVIGPFEAWLLVRGMRTLTLRVAHSSASAQRIASWLAAHEAVARVLYPGLPEHTGHEIAARQMSGGFGGLLSIRLQGGGEAARRFCGRLRLFHRATSLGGVESLAEHRHEIEPAVPPDLVRLSIGIEDLDDLVADLEQALS